MAWWTKEQQRRGVHGLDKIYHLRDACDSNENAGSGEGGPCAGDGASCAEDGGIKGDYDADNDSDAELSAELKAATLAYSPPSLSLHAPLSIARSTQRTTRCHSPAAMSGGTLEGTYAGGHYINDAQASLLSFNYITTGNFGFVAHQGPLQGPLCPCECG